MRSSTLLHTFSISFIEHVDNDESKMVFGNSQFKETENIKEAVANMTDALKNPYFNLYHWCKGELFDIISVNNALSGKDKIFDRINKSEKKKRSRQDDLDNVTTGRKTVKTMFKSQGDTGAMVDKIENVSKELSFHLLNCIFVLDRLTKKLKT